MDKLTFKNYPASTLVFLLCFFVAVNFAFTEVYGSIWPHKNSTLLHQVIIIICSYSTVAGAMAVINKYFLPKWLFSLLGLPRLKGTYTGVLTSSYHTQPDSPQHIQLFCIFTVVQNINALKIEGNFYTDQNYTRRSSGFESAWEEVKKKDDGNFAVRYFYSNKGSQLHPDNDRYNLTSHEGVAVLIFNPAKGTLAGYYFNHERFSRGEISLTRK